MASPAGFLESKKPAEFKNTKANLIVIPNFPFRIYLFLLRKQDKPNPRATLQKGLRALSHRSDHPHSGHRCTRTPNICIDSFLSSSLYVTSFHTAIRSMTSDEHRPGIPPVAPCLREYSHNSCTAISQPRLF